MGAGAAEPMGEGMRGDGSSGSVVLLHLPLPPIVFLFVFRQLTDIQNHL